MLHVETSYIISVTLFVYPAVGLSRANARGGSLNHSINSMAYTNLIETYMSHDKLPVCQGQLTEPSGHSQVLMQVVQCGQHERVETVSGQHQLTYTLQINQCKCPPPH